MLTFLFHAHRQPNGDKAIDSILLLQISKFRIILEKIKAQV